jgi:hypothetical protein
LTLTGENQGSRDIPQDHGLDGHLAKVIETANRILAKSSFIWKEIVVFKDVFH